MSKKMFSVVLGLVFLCPFFSVMSDDASLPNNGIPISNVTLGTFVGTGGPAEEPMGSIPFVIPVESKNSKNDLFIKIGNVKFSFSKKIITDEVSSVEGKFSFTVFLDRLSLKRKIVRNQSSSFGVSSSVYEEFGNVVISFNDCLFSLDKSLNISYKDQVIHLTSKTEIIIE